jgi:hypothetical protein
VLFPEKMIDKPASLSNRLVTGSVLFSCSIFHATHPIPFWSKNE